MPADANGLQYSPVHSPMSQLCDRAELDSYNEGIDKLLNIFPNAWPDLMDGDDIMRKEQWPRMVFGRFLAKGPTRVATTLTSLGGGVIHRSSIGVVGPRSEWWNIRFVLPHNTAGGPVEKMRALEGGAPPMRRCLSFQMVAG